MDQGLTPEAWVRIVKSGLTKNEAKKLEYSLIALDRPRFNYQLGDNFKLTKDQIIKAYELREQGFYYNQIGERLGVSTMTIWRYLNG